MKKIGIIDYFIDEWHSNTYLGLFEKANKELGLDYQVAYGYAEIDKEGRLTTDEWCKKNNIVRCHSIEELCEKSDNILILSCKSRNPFEVCENCVILRKNYVYR